MTTATVIPGSKIHLVDPEQIAPFPFGLYAHVNWVSDGDGHFLQDDGVVFRPMNFGGASEFGVYGADWCEDPTLGDLDGTRPDLTGYASDPFVHESVWASDKNPCGDLTSESRQSVRDRVLHNFMRLEQVAAERQFATRLVADATVISSPITGATSIKDAVGQIEDAAAALGVGDVFIHAKPYWATQEYGLFAPDLKTLLGSQLVIGGGYVDGLGATVVATTPVYGWRTTPDQQEAITYDTNQMYALAQRSVLFGYEKVIAAVTIS